jgi:lysophospholipase L1-like esterase
MAMKSDPKKPEKPQNLICFGDSITQGAGLAENHRWTARLAFLLEERFPERFDVFNRGVGGNTTAMALDRIQADVVPLLPAIVLIEFGINDAYVYPWCKTPRVGLKDFRRNLEEIIRQVLSSGGHPRLIINHPFFMDTPLLFEARTGVPVPASSNLTQKATVKEPAVAGTALALP